ncbi:hypothetical protein ES703_65555 [subsurface metagenome]
MENSISIPGKIYFAPQGFSTLPGKSGEDFNKPRQRGSDTSRIGVSWAGNKLYIDIL